MAFISDVRGISSLAFLVVGDDVPPVSLVGPGDLERLLTPRLVGFDAQDSCVGCSRRRGGSGETNKVFVSSPSTTLVSSSASRAKGPLTSV